MEAWIFGVFSGLWLDMLFVAIGVIIGKVHSYYHQKPHKDNAEHVRDRNNHSDVHSGGTDNVHIVFWETITGKNIIDVMWDYIFGDEFKPTEQSQSSKTSSEK